MWKMRLFSDPNLSCERYLQMGKACGIGLPCDLLLPALLLLSEWFGTGQNFIVEAEWPQIHT